MIIMGTIKGPRPQEIIVTISVIIAIDGVILRQIVGALAIESKGTHQVRGVTKEGVDNYGAITAMGQITKPMHVMPHVEIFEISGRSK